MENVSPLPEGIELRDEGVVEPFESGLNAVHHRESERGSIAGHVRVAAGIDGEASGPVEAGASEISAVHFGAPRGVQLWLRSPS